MTTIINIRGTNGSGKSTLALSMLDPGKERYEVELGGAMCLTDLTTALIGPYPPGKTGGCDRISKFETMRTAIRVAALNYPFVVFEGITVSTTFGSWAEFCLTDPFIWAYIDTPLDTCLARVRHRNGGAEFKEEMVVDKFRAIAATRTKALAAGYRVVDLDYRDAHAQLSAVALLD